MVVVGNVQTAIDGLGGVGPVGTCHARYRLIPHTFDARHVQPHPAQNLVQDVCRPFQPRTWTHRPTQPQALP